MTPSKLSNYQIGSRVLVTFRAWDGTRTVITGKSEGTITGHEVHQSDRGRPCGSVVVQIDGEEPRPVYIREAAQIKVL